MLVSAHTIKIRLRNVGSSSLIGIRNTLRVNFKNGLKNRTGD